MTGLRISRVGVVLAPDDPFAPYYREVLAHAGLVFVELPFDQIAAVDNLDVLLLCGRGQVPMNAFESIRGLINAGGSVVCSGSAWGLHGILGLEPTDPSELPGNDTVFPLDPSDPLWPSGMPFVRYFGGARTITKRATEHVLTGDRSPAVTSMSRGKGKSFFVAPHIGESVCLMQLGRALEVGSVGNLDGSVRFDRGVLRAEESANLSFDHDRHQVDGKEAAFFTLPHADALREMFVRTVIAACNASGSRAAMTWFWPNNANAVLATSVDCTEFEPDNVMDLHRVFSAHGFRVSWLIGPPGYPLTLYRNLKRWGDEFGLMWPADDQSAAQLDRVRIQNISLARATGSGQLHGVRPADGRWRGYLTLYEIAEKAGNRLMLARGGRQPETAGFLFGGSHPIYPHRPDGSRIPVLDLPYHMHEPGNGVTEAMAEHILDQVRQRHGCVQIALNSESLGNTMVGPTMGRVAGRARTHHFDMMGPTAVCNFEMVRRSLRFTSSVSGGFLESKLISEADVQGLTIMLSGKGLQTMPNERLRMSQVNQRYGQDFTSFTVDLDAKSPLTVRIAYERARQAAA